MYLCGFGSRRRRLICSFSVRLPFIRKLQVGWENPPVIMVIMSKRKAENEKKTIVFSSVTAMDENLSTDTKKTTSTLSRRFLQHQNQHYLFFFPTSCTASAIQQLFSRSHFLHISSSLHSKKYPVQNQIPCWSRFYLWSNTTAYSKKFFSIKKIFVKLFLKFENFHQFLKS